MMKVILVVLLVIVLSSSHSQVNWRLVYHESFQEDINEPSEWTEDTYGEDSPWHVGPFDEDGDFFYETMGSAFSDSLAKFRSFRKSFSFGEDNWLTAELYGRDANKDGIPESGGTFVVQDGIAKLISQRHTDGAIIRSTNALPDKYRIEVTVKNIYFGGDLNDNGDWYDDGYGDYNGYSETEYATPWKVKPSVDSFLPVIAYGENGVYFLCITDYENPAPHNNVFIHHHRKVVMDTDNHDYWGEPWSTVYNPNTGMFEPDGNRYISMIFLNGESFGSDWSGNSFHSWTPGGWKKGAYFADKYIPDESYIFSIERDGENYTMSVSGNMFYGGNTTYIATKSFTSKPYIWHYNQTPEVYDGRHNETKAWNGNSYETWPSNSAYPDYFFFGDPHINFYQGTAEFSDVKLYLPDTVSSIKTREDETAENFVLYQNYPNPFNEITHVRYSVFEDSFVEIEIYNSNGEKIESLINEYHFAGNYNVFWNAEKRVKGIFICKMQISNSKGVFFRTKSMMLL